MFKFFFSRTTTGLEMTSDVLKCPASGSVFCCQGGAQSMVKSYDTWSCCIVLSHHISSWNISTLHNTLYIYIYTYHRLTYSVISPSSVISHGISNILIKQPLYMLRTWELPVRLLRLVPLGPWQCALEVRGPSATGIPCSCRSSNMSRDVIRILRYLSNYHMLSIFEIMTDPGIVCYPTFHILHLFHPIIIWVYMICVPGIDIYFPSNA